MKIEAFIYSFHTYIIIIIIIIIMILSKLFLFFITGGYLTLSRISCCYIMLLLDYIPVS